MFYGAIYTGACTPVIDLIKLPHNNSDMLALSR
jgi:hypothetical protein